MIFIFLSCVVGGLAIFYLLVRPFTRPLQDRIPGGKQYRAFGGAKQNEPVRCRRTVRVLNH